ncbi:protein kinase domain-containing protein [Aeromicrobium wangtongii]|uniref:non-specific serine/threonine protein kinase n=1 Tax=Aeromicrobium wangtongii TaxID=2969247 RepID=A0ABY5M4Y5_9ACTN|nr:protein kinase [Aeromicrobium wangtongii]MCD9198719.1 protein kinase [Aeromicrobium wangtongii]UUP13235.1 protein kinase [Aeromicrobium wangtongii]
MSEVLNDRYELGDVVGSGGMGAVHRATDLRLGRTVAVKILRGDALADGTARARMRSEASLAASINHPGVARVFDFHEGAPSSGSPTFIVMEMIEGRSLAQLLGEHGPLPTDQVMSVVVQVAEGLQAAHDAGIVHRDLKPANIMLTPAGRTVLVDFGIARSATSDPLTSTGVLVGTADYMSPEQAAGRSATPASDLYALGVVAHHCLTGTSPFRRESQVATAVAHLNEDAPDLGGRVPQEVADLVGSLTARNPADRPTSAAAVALQAAAIGAAGAIELPATFEWTAPDVQLTETTPAVTALPGRAVAPAAGVRTRRPAKAYAGIGIFVVCLALLGVQSMRPDPNKAMVPDVVGMNVDDATARIRDAGLAVGSTSVDAGDVPAGQVVDQSPDSGRPGSRDERVELSVASGRVMLSADDVIGTTYTKAADALAEQGFEVVRQDIAGSAEPGTVLGLDRSGRLAYGSSVTLTVAVAPARTASQGSASSTSTGGAASKRAAAKKGPAAKAPAGKAHAPKGKGKPPGRK